MYSVPFNLVKPRLVTTCYRIQSIRNFLNKQLIFNTLKMQAESMDTFLPHLKKALVRSGVSVQIQVVGSGAFGVPSSVVLINNNARYLINCGEGTQRLGNEYRMGLEKSKNIFITYPSWKNISGLLGLFLDNGKLSGGELLIHGQSCIAKLFSATKKFVHSRDLPRNFKHCNHYETFSDNNISVKYVYLHPVGDTKKDSVDDKKKHSRNQQKKSTKEGSPIKEKVSQHTVCFIFDTGKTCGALCFKKCIDLGVPPGPLLGELKSGKDVILKNGNVVRSVDVTEPDLPGVIVIAVELPSEKYLDSLLKEPEFCKYQTGENNAGAIIHFSSSKIIKNEKYQEWINRFPKTTKHLFINEDNKATGSVGTQRQQYKLNYLYPEFFPLLQDTQIPDFPRLKNTVIDNGHSVVTASNQCEDLNYTDKVFYKCNENSFINGETLCTLYFKPKYEYDYSKCLVLKKELFLQEMFKGDFKEKIDKCKEKIKEIERSIESDNRTYPKVVFLGTGSSKPSKVRNASGILIFLDKNKSILFDCGENTYNQLINFYGRPRVSEILRNLDAIFISHLHVDHHLGLITLLKERKLAFDELNQLSYDQSNVETDPKAVQSQFRPVFVLAPVQIRHWLQTYNDEIEDISKLFDLLPNSFLIEGNKDLISKAELCKKTLNLENILTTQVYHCKGAFGVSIIHKDGWKITYSGDTKPCHALVKLGKNSDILIHESTLEDAYFKEAEVKCHSTTSQAIEIGQKMNANYILLTHFSQRYCYLPVIDEKFKNLNIGVAFDFMEVPFNKLPILPALLEPLQYIYSEFNDRVKTITQYVYLKRGIHETDFSPSRNLPDEIRSPKILKKSLENKN